MLANNWKIAFRNLSRHRSYGAINIIGLALSMASVILIFTFVKYHLSFDDFHKDPGTLYRAVTEQHRDNISYTGSVPPAFGAVLRKDYPFTSQIARTVIYPNEQVMVGTGATARKFKENSGVIFAEPDYLNIFNFPLVAGRASAIVEPNTVLLTEKIAKKYFGTADALNQTLTIDNKDVFKVVGILKDLPPNTDQHAGIILSWSNLKHYNTWVSNDESWGGITDELQCFVRLRPDVSVAAVESALREVPQKYRPKSKNVHIYKLQRFADMHYDPRYGGSMDKKNLWVLSVIGLFLLITTCVNFINLATAQALRRAKEIGIKKVLGGLRYQLFGQFLAETGLIAISAAILAVIGAWLLLPSINDWFHSQMTARVFLDTKLLLFIPLLILTVTLLAGAYPGIVLSGFQPIMALKSKITQQQIGGWNIRRTLIVAQFTISLVLIIGMIVITRQTEYARDADLGFEKDAVVMLPMGGDKVTSTVKTLKSRLAQLPGVEQVSLCYSAPASDERWNTGIKYDNRSEEEPFRISIKAADDQYVPAFDLKLVAGRNIFPSDSIREGLVNEAMIRRLNISNPAEIIGKTITFNGNWKVTVVGVLKDFHDMSLHQDISPLLVSTILDNYGSFAVRVDTRHLATILPALEKTWSSAFPNQVYESSFLADRIAAFYETEEMMLKIIQAFSLIAIFIGCLGLYGLVSFMAAQKTREIGIRKVLGSTVGEILWIFGKEFTLLIGIAFLIAAPMAWWFMHNWLQNFKFHITIGPSVFLLAIGATLAVSFLTIGYRSWQAARMNPVKSLKTE